MYAYHSLEAHFKKIYNINSAKSMLHWDSAVMMPAGGQEERAEQLATLDAISHDMLTAPSTEELLDSAEGRAHKETLSVWQQANLREMRRLWRHANAVDESLVTALTRAGSKCELVWRSARADNDFAAFAPLLKNVLSIVREIAQAKAESFGCTPYDALLDQYDPGRQSADIDAIFSELENFLPNFIEEVIEHQSGQPPIIPLEGPFPIEKQKELGLLCMQTLGFDFNHGRLDVSHHPFCGGVPSDVRITTRYDEHDFLSALMGVQHETGHALYEMHLPKEWREQPVGQACGMSIHESQSLLIEMQACRSREVLSFLLPHMKAIFGLQGKAWEVDNLYRIATKVERSLIRVDADEVTYPAHVMLRYKLEKALLSGDLEVEYLPDAWNELMQKMIGITPDSDKNGCMQDIHWTDGSFGYFPTYTLGAIHAAQFFKKAKNVHPEIPAELEKGDFSTLTHWLKDHVHQYGLFYHANELLTHATGSPINVALYKDYLQERYLA